MEQLLFIDVWIIYIPFFVLCFVIKRTINQSRSTSDVEGDGEAIPHWANVHVSRYILCRVEGREGGRGFLTGPTSM